MAESGQQKSMNVRIQTAVVRAGFKIGELAGPGVTARVAAWLWCRIPAKTEREPEPAGGTPFEAVAQGCVVRGAWWGDGPVVYLVHGWAGSGGQLSSFVSPLVRAGFRVVSFDGPGHGRSDPGPHGPRSSDGVEFGRALDAVAAVHGPAHGVIAHSMGAIATMLTLRYGWLSTRRLAFLAPMQDLQSYLDQFCAAVGIGVRTRRRLEAALLRRTGVSVPELDVSGMISDADSAELLVVHDRQDRRTAYDRSVELVASWPGATLATTERLGHRRLLHDAEVVAAVCRFLAPDAPIAASGLDVDSLDRLSPTGSRRAA